MCSFALVSRRCTSTVLREARTFSTSWIRPIVRPPCLFLPLPRFQLPFTHSLCWIHLRQHSSHASIKQSSPYAHRLSLHSLQFFVLPPSSLSFISSSSPSLTGCGMALSSSAQLRMLESPISHQDLFGVEHPLTQHSKKKKKRSNGTTSGQKPTLGGAVFGGSGSAKQKKRADSEKSKSCAQLGGKRLAVATKDPARASSNKPRVVNGNTSSVSSMSHTHYSSPSFSLAQVELDSSQPHQRLTGSNSGSRKYPVTSNQRGHAWSSKHNQLPGSRGGRKVAWESKVRKSGRPWDSRASSGVGVTQSAVGIDTAIASKISHSRPHPKTNLLPTPSHPPYLKPRLAPSSGYGQASIPREGRTVGSVASFLRPPRLRVPQRTFLSATGEREQFGLEEIARGLGRLKYRHVVVMSGAGISTASGIPDFRTPGTGLYDNLEEYDLPDPTAVFDMAYFSRNPRPFFRLAKKLYPGEYSPSLAHCFVRLLQDKGILLRNYTQNIDGLERLAGVSGGKLVEAHGTFSTASCTRCNSKQDPLEIKRAIYCDQIPRCRHKFCSGVVKPDIVFFGEDLPQRFHTLQLPDFTKCDLLIVMGTSLEVEPFASLVALSRHTVPRLLLNRELVGPFKQQRGRSTDVAVIGDLVQSVRMLVEGANWTKNLEDVVKQFQNQRSDAVSKGVNSPMGNSSNNATSLNYVTSTLGKLHLEDSAPRDTSAGPCYNETPSNSASSSPTTTSSTPTSTSSTSTSSTPTSSTPTSSTPTSSTPTSTSSTPTSSESSPTPPSLKPA